MKDLFKVTVKIDKTERYRAICCVNITTNDDTKRNSNNFKIFLAWKL